jgi:transcriptional regulator with XRE-family HTH domain
MDAAALIRHARAVAGLTQAELAHRAGVKQPEIARLEAAGANPRISTLDKVVAATGHTLNLGLDRGAGIDESLIAASLRQGHAERLRQFESLYKFTQRFGGRASAAGGS